MVDALLDEPEPALDDVEWIVGTGRWEAVCSAVDGDRHLTMLLKVIRGNWQMVYQHRG